MSVTLYNAVICLVLSVWVGINFDRGRFEKIVKKKKAGHVVGKPLDSFKTLIKKRLYKRTYVNIKCSYTSNETPL